MHPSDQNEPGIRRRRRGRGFSYSYPDGRPVRDPATLNRIKALAVPPAWKDVWICRSADGHLQAAGTDAAGRRQYRYHDEWRAQQDRLKFDKVLEMAERLPAFRKRVQEHLETKGLTRQRVLAAAARLLDVGFFRVGGEEYESYGLATLRMEHVSCVNGSVVFCYPAKGDIPREVEVSDRDACRVIRSLKARCREGELLRYKDENGWTDVRSAEINAYVRETLGCEATAKDFRTWHGTVLAAVGLASTPNVPEVMRQVADYLGNTPTVARASYVDPRVIEAFERGRTIDTGGDVESAVIDLIRAV
ncbi:DNA topoisomerase IB [Nonomuraea sp. NPDC049152]|uniref:DNA topoisomerase IB n=1 Tax=Nonomuraea sp. NPDC049152 TaxID=3154350 RepID=UPI0033EFC0B9